MEDSHVEAIMVGFRLDDCWSSHPFAVPNYSHRKLISNLFYFYNRALCCSMEFHAPNIVGKDPDKNQLHLLYLEDN